MDLRVSELLEELYDSGRTPEEVCVDFPEFLDEVRERWRKICRLEAQLDLCLPPEREPLDAGARPRPRVPDDLPQIPGYEVEGRIGRGGMGVVYRARHLRLNRVVAIKMAIAWDQPSSRERFRREAQAVAALRHPHVVQIYDVGDWEGCPYYAMELVAGGNLAQLAKPTSPREAASLLLPLAEAVHAAHSAGIIHRDLKPSNILMEPGGTPKVGDFGLSRRLDDASGLTMDGVLIGTPSYMAPEQAAGTLDAVGAPADVYALGAILYELLSGRPPFRGETPSETARLVIDAEPIPPVRLNPKIPRDLEIICLKCLNKDPARRYPTAAALGDDLRHFLDGEAIEARPEGRAERLMRRLLRRPGYFASLAAPILLALLAGGAGLWLARDRAETHRRSIADLAATERAVSADLREMNRWLEAQSWTQAIAAFERAKARLGDGRGSRALRLALDRGGRDLEFVARLEAIRTELAENVEDAVDFKSANTAYESAFVAAGVGKMDEPPEVVAARIRASKIRGALVDALDAWPVDPSDAHRKARLLKTASLADRHQEAWTLRARDPQARRDRDSLQRLVAQAPVDSEAVPLLLSLAGDLAAAGGDPTPLLIRVQQAHPGDFWANVALMDHLIEAGRDAEAVRYAQAAISIRPSEPIGHTGLGRALLHSDKPDEAVEPFRTALRLDPRSPNACFNLGHVLTLGAKADEATALFRRALGISPNSSVIHCGLADALAARGLHAEALAEYERAVALDPKFTYAWLGSRQALKHLGRVEESRAAWRKAIDSAPGDLGTWDGYPEFCLYLGQDRPYRDARRELLARFGQITDPRHAEQIGRACLLLPDDRESVLKASALIDRALADPPTSPTAWARPYFLLAKSLAEYRLGHFESALGILEGDAGGVMGPIPSLIRSMAHQKLNHPAEARASFSAATTQHPDWNAPAPENREYWLYQTLRREAEATLRSPASEAAR